MGVCDYEFERITKREKSKGGFVKYCFVEYVRCIIMVLEKITQTRKKDKGRK